MPPSALPRSSIVILTFNRASSLERLLQSLSEVVSDDIEVIVVDNHSQDDPRDVAARVGIPLRYLRMDANLGVAARNRGLQQARGDLVVCLDDDVFGIDRWTIDSLRAAFEADARLAAINFKVLDPRTSQVCNWVHHCEEERFADGVFDTYEITEGAVAFRRSALAEAGWYPEYFFLSHEGPDLAFRLMDRGYRVIYQGDVAVWHWHATEGRGSWTNYYYDTRNQYWLAARNFALGYAFRYLARGQVSTCLYALRDGHLGYWLKAVRDGVAGLKRVQRDRRIVGRDTMSAIRAIDARRPSWVYMARKRLLQKAMRL